MNRVALSVFLAVFGLGACQTMNPQEDRPARLEKSDEATDRLLSEVVGSALGQPISLLSKPLMTSSLLSLENRLRDTVSSSPVNGRIMEKPIQFQLVENSGKCYLIDSRDKARYLLERVVCVPENS